MSDEIYSQRKHLTFAQAEGAEPLPTQLQLGQVSSEMRAFLWMIVYRYMQKSIARSSMGGSPWLEQPWEGIMKSYSISVKFEMVDDFNNDAKTQIGRAKTILQHGNYIEVFSFIQFILRQRACPLGFANHINQALENSRCAYRVYNGDTVIPISDDYDGRSIAQAFVDLRKSEFGGARTHLRSAGSLLTDGQFSDSVRESIHAVESVARSITSSGTLGDALIELERSRLIHPALKKGFSSIYGYSSDEKGIRHPLIDDAKSNVDETDAIFMISACCAFISYLISKARTSG